MFDSALFKGKFVTKGAVLLFIEPFVACEGGHNHKEDIV